MNHLRRPRRPVAVFALLVLGPACGSSGAGGGAPDEGAVAVRDLGEAARDLGEAADISTAAPADWLPSATIYAVFPEIFSAAGNLAGVTDKLAALRGLGFNVVYL